AGTRRAEPGEGALSCRSAEEAVLRTFLQRIRCPNQRKVSSPGERRATGTKNHRRTAARTILPGAIRLRASVGQRDIVARAHGRSTESILVMVSKVRPHITQNEQLVFEMSSPGKRGYQLPPLDVPAVDPKAALGSENVRDEIDGFPEISEVEV